jgi:error-prone DNA polymerase
VDGKARREDSACRGGARVTLLARNRDGYGELCRLVTARHLDDDFSLAAALDGVSDNVYLLADDERVLRRFRGRDRLRLPLPVASGREWTERRWHLRAIASRLGVRTVAAGEIFFIHPKEHLIHKVLTAMRTRTTIGTLPRGAAAPPCAFFHSPRDVKRVFADDPDSFDEACAIAGDCAVELALHSSRLPRFALPPGEAPAPMLGRLARRGLRERYELTSAHRSPGADEWQRACETLEYELSVVSGKGLAGYFLICWDIVRFARNRGLRSLGRGSAGNSILSYALGITHVNPLRHNLFFERFLNPEREQLPDFDIDFATDDREEVLRYIFRRYGRERVAMIGTYATFRARGALRETAKALGIPESEVAPFIKRIPFFASIDHLAERCAVSPAAADIPLDREPFRTLLPLAVHIGGFPRHMATHPCGLVIMPTPITGLIPLHRVFVC